MQNVLYLTKYVAICKLIRNIFYLSVNQENKMCLF